MIEAFDFWKDMNVKLGTYQDLAVFKTWDLVQKIPIYTDENLYYDPVNKVGYLPDNQEMLTRSPHQQEWLKVLIEPKRGHTDQSYKQMMNVKFWHIQTSSFVMKTLHHLLTFEELRGRSILSYDHIIEFGAGIGETARMIFDRGYTGTYTIVDLPNVGRIADYYLDGKVTILNAIDDYESRKNSLFIATWSLSEVPVDLRWKVAQKIKDYDQLIIFQAMFEQENNVQFFVSNSNWARATHTFQRYREIEFHKANGGNHYLVATTAIRLDV